MAIQWTDSADKHGIPHEQAMFALANHRWYVPEFDESRVGGRRPDLYIGPAWLGGPLLEVMLFRVPPRDLVIFHVMGLRPKIQKLAEELTQEEE